LLVVDRAEEQRVQSVLFEIILDRAFREGLAIRALKDLDVLVPVDGWKLQELVRGESVGEAALGWEPIAFLDFGNSNVLRTAKRM